MSEAKQLVISFKRKGHFDGYRKSLYDNFKSSKTHHQRLIDLIQDKITKKIKEDPKLLQQNKGKLSGLMTGLLYKDEIINKIIEDSIKEAMERDQSLRDGIREKIKGIEKDLKEKSQKEASESKS